VTQTPNRPGFHVTFAGRIFQPVPVGRREKPGKI
jgi:hypothetical protein